MSMDIRSFFSKISKKTDSSPKPQHVEKTTSKKRTKDANSSIEDIIPETPDIGKKGKNSKKNKPVPELKRRKIIILSDSESDDEKTKKIKKGNLTRYKNNDKKKSSKIETISDSETDYEKTKKDKKENTSQHKNNYKEKSSKIETISDSESDDEKPKKNKEIKTQHKNNEKNKSIKTLTISDSESDNENKKDIKVVPVKPSKSDVIPKVTSYLKPKELDKKPKKIINPLAAFGDEPIQQKKIQKPKNQGTELDIHDDDDFEKTLMDLDESELIPETLNSSIGKDIKELIPNKDNSEKKKSTPVKKNIKDDLINNKSNEIKELKNKLNEFKNDRRSRSKSPQNSYRSPKKSVDSATSSTPTITPSRKRKISDSEHSSADQDQERYEKKRYSAMLYQKYLNRSGPANLHSKWIPKGKSSCLKDLGFLITGVLDSLTREEAEELIVTHGGRCVKSLSKKIKYLVVGEDAGPAKLEKAREYGTKILTEDDLIDLICIKSGIENKNKSSNNEKNDENEKVQVINDEKKNSAERKKEEIVPKENKQSNKISLETLKNNKIKDVNEDDDEIPEITVKKDEVKSKIYLKDAKSKIEKPSTSVEKKCQLDTTQKIIPSDQLAWVDKYKPTDMKGIIGQQSDNSNVKKLYNWLRKWYSNHDGTKKIVKPSPWAKNDDGAYFKAALLSGPPGVGKTTTSTIVSKELGFDVVEFNASDTRSKKMLGDEISTLLKSKSLSGYFKDGSAPTNKHVLLMDEVDGMSGNEDRGGMQELINLIKSSSVPIICMCNDRQHPKVRSLANYCFDLRFNKPKLEQIRGAMMSVCFKEDIKISSEALTDVIMGAGMDIRQTLNNLSMWSAKENTVSKETAKKEASIAVKDVKLGPWEVIRKVFSEDEHKNMSIDDKYGLFFYDYSINPLFVQENYLQVKPHCSRDEVLKRFALAADSISLGDLVDAKIRTDQKWGLLDSQALFSSVIPGQSLKGHFAGQINFPGWLGKNSKANKFKRMISELQCHMRMSISGSRQAVNLDYLNHIYNALITPLVKEGMNGIPKAIAVMQEYNLMREDFTNIVELVHWPKSKDLFKDVDSKVKAAFTRAYNKDIILPYAVTAVPVKKRRGGGNEDDAYGEEEEEEEEEEDDNINNNPMIKVKKPAAKTENKSTKVKEKKGKDTKTKSSSKPHSKRGK